MTTPVFPPVDPVTGALPAFTEARYIRSNIKGIAGGVAEYDSAGNLVNAAGTPVLNATAASIGLGNVQNTADADKGISTAQATQNTALNNSITANSNSITALNGQVSLAALKAATRVVVKQVGDSYPTPLPTGYAAYEFVGINDPALQVGIVLSDNDEWNQPT